MTGVQKVTLQAKRGEEWTNVALDTECYFNPREYTLEKGVHLAEIPIPGLDSPLQQFVRGNAEKLTLELFFDTTDRGMGDNAVSVTTKTDPVYQLIKVKPNEHAPPVCRVVWGSNFPGDSPPAGGERRYAFQCLVEGIRQTFTLFSPRGVPLRATLTLTLREYRTLEEQLGEANPSSPDRTHAHVMQRGETLSRIAGLYWDRPGEWRHIAEANGIDDARRLSPGTFLTIPRIR